MGAASHNAQRPQSQQGGWHLHGSLSTKLPLLHTCTADDVLRTALKDNNEKTRLRSENGVLGCHTRPDRKKKDVQGYDDI